MKNIDMNIINKLKFVLTDLLSFKSVAKDNKKYKVFYLHERFLDNQITDNVKDEVAKVLPENIKPTVSSKLLNHPSELTLSVNIKFVPKYKYNKEKDPKVYKLINGLFWDITEGEYYLPNVFRNMEEYDKDILDNIDADNIKKLSKEIDDYNDWLFKYCKSKDNINDYDIIWRSSTNRNRLDYNALSKLFKLDKKKKYVVDKKFKVYGGEEMCIEINSSMFNYKLDDYLYYVLNCESFDYDYRLYLIGRNKKNNKIYFFFRKNKSNIISAKLLLDFKEQK